MIEVEIKFEVESLNFTANEILEDVDFKVLQYTDWYFDNESLDLEKTESELRIREIISDQRIEHVLTAKAPPIGDADKNKDEYEIVVTKVQAEAWEKILGVIGFSKRKQIKKNVKIGIASFGGVDVEVSLVELPLLHRTFVEIEALTDDIGNHEDIKTVLEDFCRVIGLPDEGRTNEYYTDM